MSSTEFLEDLSSSETSDSRVCLYFLWVIVIMVAIRTCDSKRCQRLGSITVVAIE